MMASTETTTVASPLINNHEEHEGHVHGPHCNHHHHHPLKPIQRELPKVGRNDLCLCGSQKKYKKCCGK
jgi:uncharacterized protein YecA (UPF0149 family)